MSRCVAGLLLSMALAVAPQSVSRAETGYELWLRYRLVRNQERRREYIESLGNVFVGGHSPTLDVVREELTRAIPSLVGGEFFETRDQSSGAKLLIGNASQSAAIRSLVGDTELAAVGAEGFVIRRPMLQGKRVTVVAANTDIGALYGTFALLRELQMERPIDSLELTSAPRLGRRILDHWDNLDGTVERGYAGRSLWDWATLPRITPRYRDYARANASIGINGTVLTNVNADAKVLTPEYLAKVQALADAFRPYGIKVYLTARFSAPMEIGHLTTADPLDSAVRAWWHTKVEQIYRYVPDFGGFLVKANSEGQPGPQDYHRTHADGANMLADALAPHGGVVMWRAFVYSNAVPNDRVKQAYDEFTPLDGQFRSNVLLQTKNGPLDFQPREPFHPLFGAMPKTAQMIEFQITKEYLGEDTHLVYLGALFSEVLSSDSQVQGPGSTVAKIVEGRLQGQRETGMAGVANIGRDTNWTGSQFNQANWYAFGRLAWDPGLSPAAIAEEWARMTFTNDSSAVRTIVHLMLVSREAVVNYMTPLGLAHIMGTNHHYGPAPWVRLARADWSPVYYHRADSMGIGFDRTERGSNAVAQYAPAVQVRYARRATVPDSLLLWFHHVGWTERLASGRTLWDELALHYQAGVDSVRAMQHEWSAVRAAIDDSRFDETERFLAIQEREARWWRDAVLAYFETFSHLPLPASVEAPAHSLAYYLSIRCPSDEHKPRCDDIP